MRRCDACAIPTGTSPTISYADCYNIRALFYTMFAARFHHAIVPMRAVAPACITLPCDQTRLLSVYLTWFYSMPEGRGIWLLSLWFYVMSHKHRSRHGLGLSRRLDSSPSILLIKQLTGTHTLAVDNLTLTSLLSYYRMCLKITLSNSNELQTSVSYLLRSHLRKQTRQSSTFPRENFLKKDLPGYWWNPRGLSALLSFVLPPAELPVRNRDDDSLSSFKHSWSTSPAAQNWGTCHLLIYWLIVQLNHSHFTDRILRNGHPSRMARFVLIDTHPRVRVSTALSWGASRRVLWITAHALWGQGEVSWLRRSTAGTHVSQAPDYSTGLR